MEQVNTFNENGYTKNKNIIKKIFAIITIGIFILTIVLIVFVRFYKIHGSSMSPTLQENDYVICVKNTTIEAGDIIAFEKLDDIMIKRVIGTPGDIINIDSIGNVTVNDIDLEENYLKSKALGESEVSFPYVVPENSYFVLGDNRGDSLDSRHHNIGSINEELIICEVI